MTACMAQTMLKLNDGMKCISMKSIVHSTDATIAAE